MASLLMILVRLRGLSSTLPSTVPLATTGDRLAQLLAVNVHGAMACSAEDPYEVIDPTLNNVIGYNISEEDIATLI